MKPDPFPSYHRTIGAKSKPTFPELPGLATSRKPKYRPPMFLRNFALSAVVVIAAECQPPDMVRLKDGASVGGRILAEKKDSIIVDLGYTVLAIPRPEVAEISRAEAVTGGPLPETADYQIQVGAKKQAEQASAAESTQLRLKFWEGLLGDPRIKESPHAGRTSPSGGGALSGGIGKVGFSLNYVVLQTKSRVELWITPASGQTATNKIAFKALESQKGAIESDFGGPLDWQELTESDSSRICFAIEGGFRSSPDKWPAIYEVMIDAMIRLDQAMRQRVAALHL